MARKVKVVNVPGYADFRATVIPGFDRVASVDGRGGLAIVSTEEGELLVVPADNLEDVE